MENPHELNGIAFVEYSGADADFFASLFESIAMRQVHTSTDHDVRTFRQGNIRFVTNHRAGSFAHNFSKLHGPSIASLGFRVTNPRQALESLVQRGARPMDFGGAEPLIDTPAIEGIGGSCIYLLSESDETHIDPANASIDTTGAGFEEIDHLTHNVSSGEMQKWVVFYESLFGFENVFEWDGMGRVTGMQTTAVMSPCGRFRIAINEPTQAKSQIQEFIDEYNGEGVQHIAFSSPDLIGSLSRIIDKGIPFQRTPDVYYDLIDDRLPGHGENIDRLKSLGILLDGEKAQDDSWALLLQVFSKNVIGPIFFEFIQRKGNDGFGEGNAKALFESIELDQIERGVIRVEETPA